MLQLRFRPGVGGDRYQPLIANCDGSPKGPSVGIIFDTKMNELAMVVRTDTNKDSTLRFRIDVSFLQNNLLKFERKQIPPNTSKI